METEFIYKWLFSYAYLTARYFLFAGSAYILFYVLSIPWRKRKVQAKPPRDKDINREIRYSLLSLLIFSLVLAFIVSMNEAGHTKIYEDFHERSAAYWVFSLFLTIFLHDIYFYLIHRLMHTRFLFKRVHLTHHRSHNPTPWAAFSFHPLEALLEIGLLPIAVFILPVHIYVFVIFSFYMISVNIIGHLGYEIFPSGWVRSDIGRYINTSTHHNMHHKYVHCNYSLYFNFWDRLFGTMHPEYEDQYEALFAEEDCMESDKKAILAE